MALIIAIFAVLSNPAAGPSFYFFVRHTNTAAAGVRDLIVIFGDQEVGLFTSFIPISTPGPALQSSSRDCQVARPRARVQVGSSTPRRWRSLVSAFRTGWLPGSPWGFRARSVPAVPAPVRAKSVLRSARNAASRWYQWQLLASKLRALMSEMGSASAGPFRGGKRTVSFWHA